MTHTADNVVVVQKRDPNLLIRIIWFVFVGWWLSQIVILVGWLLNITVIGIPAGLWLLNRVPQAATLKMSPVEVTTGYDSETGAASVSVERPRQRPFWQRALYFIFIGWWFSFLWLEAAWLCCIT